MIIFIVIIFITITYNNNLLSKNSDYHLKYSKKELTGKARIIDGDSLFIGKNEIRLFAIDAPEYSQKCQDKNNLEYNCGDIAKKFLRNLVKGKKLKCNIIKKDYYNRLLATCYIKKNNLNINKKLISEGQATIFSNESLYFTTQEEAKNAKRGIWQGKFLTPRIYRKLKHSKK